MEGWVENTRLKHYLNRWRMRLGDAAREPTTQEIYDIMIEADREESAQSKKPFHLERLAKNIGINGIQEPIFIHYNGKQATLWDGNRRRYGAQHIMSTDAFRKFRDQARWLPSICPFPFRRS